MQSVREACRAALHLSPLAGKGRNLRALRANSGEGAFPQALSRKFELAESPFTPTLSPQAGRGGSLASPRAIALPHKGGGSRGALTPYEGRPYVVLMPAHYFGRRPHVHWERDCPSGVSHRP